MRRKERFSVPHGHYKVSLDVTANNALTLVSLAVALVLCSGQPLAEEGEPEGVLQAVNSLCSFILLQVTSWLLLHFAFLPFPSHMSRRCWW